MKAVLCEDCPVGEDRRALIDLDGRPFALHVERWSERDNRVKLDEIWWGRARARSSGGRGWFVDLGLGPDGVIEATKSRTIVEGDLIPVRVKAEAWDEKGPLLSLADMSPHASRPSRPGRHSGASTDTFIGQCEIVDTLSGIEARREIDAAVEEALQPLCPTPGGGDICIEATRAFTAIDVDTGAFAGALGVGDAFHLAVNLAAACEAARQIALRGIGGLVIMDFVGMTTKSARAAVTQAFRTALTARLGRESQVAELSPFGVCEASLARRNRPIRQALAARPDEREALDVLRLIESEGWATPGARIAARVSPGAMAWLDNDPIGWKAALADRIGRRWVMEVEERPAGPPRVWSLR
ncbi:MAG: ribonuclease E/G [Alphaproteobacteria bacterium]|nr:ribonuclease E/G [Alphaproteobacteria bacterium]